MVSNTDTMNILVCYMSVSVMHTMSGVDRDMSANVDKIATDGDSAQPSRLICRILKKHSQHRPSSIGSTTHYLHWQRTLQ